MTLKRPSDSTWDGHQLTFSNELRTKTSKTLETLCNASSISYQISSPFARCGGSYATKSRRTFTAPDDLNDCLRVSSPILALRKGLVRLRTSV
ncbi:hypothetical protein L596_020270 [Steinernema carpocapsae]|uniref:Uncharacterized protein n=1 Tax=Steinernema carpocapsae TaxID=34508 RepID=A0A4U5MT51_STECR|nr:hypothetical protein L596_020270 [Steinernema carpocapsae]